MYYHCKSQCMSEVCDRVNSSKATCMARCPTFGSARGLTGLTNIKSRCGAEDQPFVIHRTSESLPTHRAQDRVHLVVEIVSPRCKARLSRSLIRSGTPRLGGTDYCTTTVGFVVVHQCIISQVKEAANLARCYNSKLLNIAHSAHGSAITDNVPN